MILKTTKTYICYICLSNWRTSNWAETFPNAPHHSTEYPEKCCQFGKDTDGGGTSSSTDSPEATWLRSWM